MSLNDCIEKLLKSDLEFTPADAREIRALARQTGDEATGVQQYLADLTTDRQEMRDNLNDEGFNVDVPPAQTQIPETPTGTNLRTLAAAAEATQDRRRQAALVNPLASPDARLADKTAHKLSPYLRFFSDTQPETTKKQAMVQDTNNRNAEGELVKLDRVLEAHPEAHTSPEAWGAMLADAFGTPDVPMPPRQFIEDINGSGSRQNLSKLTPGQIEDADHGFENAAEFRQAYIDGQLGVDTTAKLFLWSFLSRGVSPYTQESLFIDAFPSIDPWLEQAASGEFDLEGYTEWAKSVAPKGSGQPGAGSTHNLNAFGKNFLVKMSQDVGDGTGRSRLQYIHDLMEDPNSTGKHIRREFAKIGEGVGIDNKVVSFTLLVAGFSDIMVLDRVQFRQFYNDGRFSGINLYDGRKEDGKVVKGSSFAKQGDGVRGILIYEAVERAIEARIDTLYAELGREGQGSVGRYHWETWVADSEQEASHGSLAAILPDALGNKSAINEVTAKQGEYGSYAYGARYGVDGSGTAFFTYPVPHGKMYVFTVEQFVAFQAEIKKPRNGVVPSGFKVTESGNAPWQQQEGVNVEALDTLAANASSGEAGQGQGTIRQDGADQALPTRRAAAASSAVDLFQGGPPTPGQVNLRIQRLALESDIRAGEIDENDPRFEPGEIAAIRKEMEERGTLFQGGTDRRQDVNPLGFFSAARRAVASFKEDSGTGKRWLKRLTDTTKKTEMNTIVGLREMLASSEGRISKEDMLEFIDNNGLVLEEVILQSKEARPLSENLDAVSQELMGVSFSELSAPRQQELREEITAHDRGEGTGLLDQFTEPDAVSLDDPVIAAQRKNVEISAARLERSKDAAIELRNSLPSDEVATDQELKRLEEIVNRDRQDVRDSNATLTDLQEESRAKAPVFAGGNLEIPGGTNSREFYLVLPDTASPANAKVKDWLVPEGHEVGDPVADNRLVVRIRVNERTGPDGERILFIEEMQGDRQQVARDVGGFGPETVWAVKVPGTDALMRPKFPTREAAQGLADTMNADPQVPVGYTVNEIPTPDAIRVGPPPIPWGTDSEWGRLALKRIIFKAVEEGFDAVAWTPGEIQNERYSLSKKLDRITVTPADPSGNRIIMAFDPDGATVLASVVDKDGLVKDAEGGDKTLDQIVGKELADRLLSDEKPIDRVEPDKVDVFYNDDVLLSDVDPAQVDELVDHIKQDGDIPADAVITTKPAFGEDPIERRTFTGVDLEIGGKGMIQFYDKTVKDIAGDVGKPFGAKVGVTTISKRGPGDIMLSGADRDAAGLTGHPIIRETEFDENDDALVTLVNEVTGERIPMPGATNEEIDARTVLELDIALGAAGGQEIWTLPITDKMKEQVGTEGLSLFQPQQIGDSGTLGSFNAADPNNIKITLFEGQDLSTLLHESGHMFVHMMERMASLPGASSDIKKNYVDLLEWVGAVNADDLNVAIHGDAARAKQEKLAEAFEAYLKEGKAPSTKLQSVFAEFAQWLKIIYTKFRDLGTEIDPEISRIFDRMLATDAQIENMKNVNEFDASADPGSLDLMTAEERGRWVANQDEADEVARTEAARATHEAEARAEQEVWINELERLKQEVSIEVWSRPEYQAFWYLTRGGFKDRHTPSLLLNKRLSKKELLADELLDMDEQDLKDLPKSGGKVIYTSSKEDVYHHDVLAPFLGYTDGAALIKALQGLVPAEQAIDEAALALMNARNPSPLEDGTLEALTEEALYNEERLQALDIELTALARASGQHKEGKQTIKAIVDRVVAERPVSEMLSPHKYMSAAIRAAQASARAAAKKDYVTAFNEKRKQMFQHEMMRRSLKLKKEIDSSLKFVKKFNKKKQKGIDADYLDRIDEILSVYNLGPPMTDRKRTRIIEEEFMKWINDVRHRDGAILMVSKAIFAADSKTDYRDVPVAEFQGMVATIRNLDKQGQNVKKGINAQQDVERDTMLTEMEVRMADTPQRGRQRRAATRGGKGLKDRILTATYDPIASAFATVDAAMLKTEFLLEFMDGGPTGPAHTGIFQPFVDAEFAENTLVQEFSDAFSKALDALPKKVRRKLSKTVFVPALGQNFSRGQLLHIALNTGNDSNMRKMIDGSAKDVLEGSVPLTEDGVMEALRDLSKEEIAFVNTVWSLFEKMRPAVGAVSRKENGREPVWMDNVKTELPNGTLTGGYIPMMYDPRRSGGAADIENSSALEMMKAEVTQASVFSGMTKTRSEGFAEPLLLDLTRLPGELQRTAHFITHYDAVRNANKIIADRRFRSMVVNKFGDEYYGILKSWVGQVAVGNRGKLRFDVIGDMVEGLRSNTTVAIMGASVTTTLTQPLGIFTAVDTLARGIDGKVMPGRGALRMAQGVLSMLIPGAATNARKLSKELQFRKQNSDRDIQHALTKLKGVRGRKAQIQRYLLMSIPALQYYTVDVPTWIAAYNMALGQMSSEKAVNFADATMRKTQGAGSAKDLSAMMATRGTARAVTMFMTFFNTLYNIQRRGGRERAWTLDFVYKATMGTMVLYVLPSIFEGLMRLQGPDEEDDLEEYLKWLAIKSALFAGSTVPIARDFVSGFGSAVYGYDPTPLSGAGESAVRAWNDAYAIAEGDKDMSLMMVRTAVSLAGYATGVIPSNQINRAIRAWEKLEENDRNFNYWQFLVGPDRRKGR